MQRKQRHSAENKKPCDRPALARSARSLTPMSGVLLLIHASGPALVRLESSLTARLPTERPMWTSRLASAVPILPKQVVGSAIDVFEMPQLAPLSPPRLRPPPFQPPFWRGPEATPATDRKEPDVGAPRERAKPWTARAPNTATEESHASTY